MLHPLLELYKQQGRCIIQACHFVITMSSCHNNSILRCLFRPNVTFTAIFPADTLTEQILFVVEGTDGNQKRFTALQASAAMPHLIVLL